ncbi:formimidoylglutamase [Pontibacter sp. HSC-14F20]|uniref:formimidoylglutamase n=1 Tax=Pontibacter sp. HSC-14F20 TaxID=2864136 RepID=UPI001C72FE69|nr:formimidoylglutamase [Pontibacter sp. HSC-14F20]MBX0331781.1 formimidoylglutamase [Pontibacter sp. HSC-14F20]
MYKPTAPGTWKGRVDATDGEDGKRWHQGVQLLNLSEATEPAGAEQAIAFLGFCCDEGVQRNQGREGAVQGPPALRQAMASFAWHLEEGTALLDAGDVYCTNQNLEEAQNQLGKKVHALLSNTYKTIILGGGHETAYGHFLGIKQALPADKQLGIINFDAHFDLRSYEKQSSSGTPFLQMADDLINSNLEFNYLCLGIQQYGNTQKLFNTAREYGADYVFAPAMQVYNYETLREKLQQFMALVDVLYVSIDLDVFAAAYAPGVSAPAALGIHPEIALILLQEIISSGKLLTLDVVELNPTLDIDNRTAKLAASLLYHVVQQWSQV